MGSKLAIFCIAIMVLMVLSSCKQNDAAKDNYEKERLKDELRNREIPKAKVEPIPIDPGKPIAKNAPQVALIKPTAGIVIDTSVYEVVWRAADIDVDDELLINLEYRESTLGNSTAPWQTLINGAENDGSYIWTLRAIPNGNFQMRITASDGEKTAQEISGLFSVEIS